MLQCRKITKCFPGVRALDEVSIDFRHGFVTGLLGENGAGKSTLMNIIYGLVRPDSGEIILNGVKYAPLSTADAIALGVGMVHQSQALIEEFTVIENIILGDEPAIVPGIINFKQAEKKIKAVFRELDCPIDIWAKVSAYDAFQKQVMEIAKILVRNADVIILDEPTSLLAPSQVKRLFAVLKNLKNQGKTIILVTHRIADVEAIVNDVVVLRQGRITGYGSKRKVRTSQLVEWIMGEKSPAARKKAKTSGEIQIGRGSTARISKNKAKVILELKSVSTSGSTASVGLRGITLAVREGEIVGLTGVPGNGQSELLELLAGLREISSGRVCYRNKEMGRELFKKRKELPVGFIFPLRDEEGLIPGFTLEENLLLNRRRLSGFSRYGWISGDKLAEAAMESIDRYSIVSGIPDGLIQILSGGNRQKVVLAREIYSGMELLVAVEPARGLDIKTTQEVRNIFLGMKERGAGILLISGDLDLILDISDKVGVLYKGRINYIKPVNSATATGIGRAMLGYK